MAEEKRMVQIERSPYTDGFAEVRFQGGTKTHVHRGVLVRCLPSSPRLIKGLKHGTPPDLILNLEDVPPHVGHVLIHFLYTGSYWCLTTDENPVADNAYALSVALEVMTTAESLEWKSMQTASLDEALRLCPLLSLPLVLEFVERLAINFDKFPRLEEHLQQRLLNYRPGPAKPLEDVILDTLKTSNTLSKVLFKILIATRCQAPADKSRTEEAPCDDDVPEPVRAETKLSTHQSLMDTQSTSSNSPEDQELDTLLEMEKKDGYLLPQDYDRLLLLWAKSRTLTVEDTETVLLSISEDQELRALIKKARKHGYLYSEDYYRLFALWGPRKRRNLKEKWNISHEEAGPSCDSESVYQVDHGIDVSDTELEAASQAHRLWRQDAGLPSVKCYVRCKGPEIDEESDWTSVGQMTPDLSESDEEVFW